MRKLDYSLLDAAILAALAEGPKLFYEFAYRDPVNTESMALEKAAGGPSVKPNWRFVDGRLQALRKQGRIAFAGHKVGWEIVPEKAAS